MNRKRHSNNSNWKNNNQRKNEGRNATNNSRPVYRSHYVVPAEQKYADEEAIVAFKSANQPVCECCGVAIMDMSSAIQNKNSGKPIHFDCALEILSKQETLGVGDKLTYIGQGRFGIVYHENPHDMKHFTIKKIIEWESKENKPEWRNQIAELYSKVK